MPSSTRAYKEEDGDRTRPKTISWRRKINGLSPLQPSNNVAIMMIWHSLKFCHFGICQWMVRVRTWQSKIITSIYNSTQIMCDYYIQPIHLDVLTVEACPSTHVHTIPAANFASLSRRARNSPSALSLCGAFVADTFSRY